MRHLLIRDFLAELYGNNDTMCYKHSVVNRFADYNFNYSF